MPGSTATASVLSGIGVAVASGGAEGLAGEDPEAGRTGLERAYIHGHRWCDETMISELVDMGETVYPLQLGELLTEANALADVRRQLQSIR